MAKNGRPALNIDASTVQVLLDRGYSWRKIGRVLNCDRKTAKRYYDTWKALENKSVENNLPTVSENNPIP